MMNAPLVQKSSVAATEVDQPKFADVLQMDESVPARHFGRFKDDGVSGGPSERTTAKDRMACAIDCFQPGNLFWGRAHAEACYQNRWQTQRLFRGSELLPTTENPLRLPNP